MLLEIIDFSMISSIPHSLEIANMLTSAAITPVAMLIKIAVPILLIIFGMLDLSKAVIAAKEDEIKKGQQTFIKRMITALIVFFVIQVVQVVVRFVSSNDNNIAQCFNCFIRGESEPFACETAVVE